MDVQAVVIVTGASGGLGAATARWLAALGAAVTLIARRAEALSRVAADVERLGGRALPVAMDVTDSRACRMAVAQTLQQFGRLDALVNNAGLLTPIAPVGETDSESWRYNIEVNLLGPFYLSQAALGALRQRQGRIVNVSSGAARRAVAAWSAYCASKAALTHFTRVLAAEESDLTVVALRPGVVDTAMQALIRRAGDGMMTKERMDYFRSLKTNGKLEPPEVPARSLAWLALYAPRALSGEFLEYDDVRISAPALARFGEIKS